MGGPSAQRGAAIYAVEQQPQHPGGAGLVERMVQHEDGLELCSSGYPAPDRYLRWGHVYVAGALAELELGPSARNIAGARLASERIVEGALLRRV